MATDPSSHANVAEVSMKHLTLNLTADFDSHVLSGSAELQLVATAASVSKVVLDTKMLSIRGVVDAVSQQALPFELSAHDDVFGQALTITLPSALAEGGEARVRVEYATSPNASAIQWLPPAQTSGKVHPYLFTQCQAIHCRSLVPIQDSPHNKFTYSANVTVPQPLVALMSAHRQECVASADGLSSTTSFHQPVCIPSYLLALAIGALESREIGPRSRVWSEKETVEAAAHEFAETEAFLAAAEDVCGPYVWGTYDILLLPPSFPYGGMENPQLTFVTPTLLAGDRSLAGVVAHEIAHSWMGNLVTCRTWESFWMNEGFTVFVERKIEQRLYGKAYAHLKSLIGREALVKSVHGYGCDHQHTCLHLPLDRQTDPDDAYSSIAYEKGYNFLCYLERMVGGEEVMDVFLKAHVQRYKYKTVESHEWKEFFLSYFRAQGSVPEETLAAIDWSYWLHTPGVPQLVEFDTSLADASTQLAASWAASLGGHAEGDLQGWKAAQVVVFLEALESQQTQQLQAAGGAGSEGAAGVKAHWRALCERMDELYHLNAVKNAEIRFHWQIVGLRAEWEVIYPLVVTFATEQGRMKFVRPLYKELNKVQPELCKQTFLQHRQSYHAIAAKMVARDLGLPASE